MGALPNQYNLFQLLIFISSVKHESLKFDCHSKVICILHRGLRNDSLFTLFAADKNGSSLEFYFICGVF